MARATPSTWGGLVDVQHAFRNLPINPFHSGLLAIEFNGHYYWELRAPFGWILAPFSWCRVSSVIQRYCSLHGINCVVYVDNFLVLGETYDETQTAIEFLIKFLSEMSLPDKVSKRTSPAKVVTFLGFVFDFPNSSVSIPLFSHWPCLVRSYLLWSSSFSFLP